jgi:ABC-2 type transport system permease protein
VNQTPSSPRSQTAPGPTLARLFAPRWLGVRNAWTRADRPRKATYLVFGGMTLAFWVGVFAVCFYFMRMFHGVEMFGPLLLRKALSMLLLSFSGLLLFSNVITALSSYYLSEDMQLVQSLPISPRRVFYFRFLDTMLGSSWMILIFGLPVLLAYGVVYGGGVVYYLLALTGLLAYLLPPAAIGVVIASLLVRGFSASRVRELMGLVSGLFVILLLLLVRALRPERLVDPESFKTLAEFIAVVRTPDASWLPSTWLSEVCVWALGQPTPTVAIDLGLLFVTGPALVVASRWIVAPLWFEAWTAAQEAPKKSASRSPWVGRLIDRTTRPLPTVWRALLRKDLRMFLREAGQWTQGMMLLGLVAIYLYSVRSLPLEQIPIKTTVLQNAIAFLNVGVAGAVLAALAVRFNFTSISREGRAFWLLHSSPVGATRYITSKFLMGLGPTLLLGETLVISTNAMLHVDPLYSYVAAATIGLLSVAVTGMAVGLGALYPDFKADNAARMAAGPGAILFMVLALTFVAGVITVESVPIGMLLARQYQGLPVPPGLIAGLVASAVLVLVACVAATVVPLRRGARALWGDLGNVGD